MRLGEGRQFLEVLAELCGREIVSTVQKSHGGRRLTLPHKPTAETWLAKIVGLEAAKTVCERFGSVEFVIPMDEHNRRAKVQREIEALWSIGWSNSRIAGELGIHQRTVQRHVAYLKSRRKTSKS